jgi:hypothetical protein
MHREANEKLLASPHITRPPQPDSPAFITTVSFTVFTEKSTQDLALANTLGR